MAYYFTNHILHFGLDRSDYGQETDKNKDSIYPLLLHVHEFKRVESTFLSEKTQG